VTGRVCLADVVPEQVAWLWPGRIPAGKIVTLDGDPGLGKSALALTVAAIVSHGGVWPDGTGCEPAGDVLIMTAEDGVADTIRPRLDAAHADLSRIHVIDHGFDERGEPTALSLADTEQIERHITETGAQLLVIDVLMAYLPGDAYRDQDVRKALTPLAKVAERTGCAMLLLRHLRKSKGGDPVHSGAGSIGIVGAARAGFVVTRDPDCDDVRILASVKSNLAICPKSLSYRLISGRSGAVAVEWLGEDRRNASELLSQGRNNLGEMSNRVSDFVNARPATQSGDIAQKFGIASKLANQYLKRLSDGGRVRIIARGVYGPATGTTEASEDLDKSEDIEDSEDSASRNDMENFDAETRPGGNAEPSLHNLQDLQLSGTRVTTTTNNPEPRTCPECAAPLGRTGKCVACIVQRACAIGSSADSDDGSATEHGNGSDATERHIPGPVSVTGLGASDLAWPDAPGPGA